jgi:hypothetical protein
MIPTVLGMNKSKVPDDIRDFFEDWLILDDKIGDNAQPISSEPSPEEVKLEADALNAIAARVESLRNWIIENSPKSLPPTIIFYALTLYNHGLFLNRLVMDRILYGSELPENLSGEDEENPTEEDEDEEVT